jgi:hypothetical protein
MNDGPASSLEPKTIRRLSEQLINKIAAGEVSFFLSFFVVAKLPHRSFIGQRLRSKSSSKIVWMLARLQFVLPSRMVA